MTQFNFTGTTVAVTGAGHGFGRAIAQSFAGFGARVFGCDLSEAELAETAKASGSITTSSAPLLRMILADGQRCCIAS